MSLSARPSVQVAAAAADARERYRRLVQLAEAAVIALESDDAERILAIVDACDALRDELEPMMRLLVGARQRIAAEPGSAAAAQAVADLLLPVEHAAQQAQAAHQRLIECARRSRDATARELDQLAQGEAVASAYQQDGARPRLNVVR